jgi:alkylation response protein AidB-like acyl-CoA dehydrogenase
MISSAEGFAATEEQQELRRSVRAFLELKSPEGEVRRVMESAEGYDPGVWRQMADQLGFQGLAVPEELGGTGFSFAELGVVIEEAGRALLPGPFFGSAVLAGSVLMCCDDDAAKSRYLPGVASGDTIATLALTEQSGRWDAEGVQDRKRAEWDRRGSSTAPRLLCSTGTSRTWCWSWGGTDAGISLFAVDQTDSLTCRELSMLDPTRRQARIDFSDTPAELIGFEGQGWPALSHALDIAAAGLAVEQVGGAQRCLELAVEYAKTRRQFGKPIGSFQAIRHKCADLMLDIECARGAAQYAVQAAASGGGRTAGRCVAGQGLLLGGPYARAAAANIQIHGGNRIHLGASRTYVFQARQIIRASTG